MALKQNDMIPSIPKLYQHYAGHYETIAGFTVIRSQLVFGHVLK